MSVIVNFYGGPGAGKSTLAADTFAALKNKGLNCELVFEYVKSWAWENRVPSKYDELYIFGQQVRRETLLYGKADVILTDRPLRLSGYYARHFGQPRLAKAMEQAAQELRHMATGDGHSFVDVFVERLEGYNPLGRYQTEAEARDIDAEQAQLLGVWDFRVTKQEAESLASALVAKISPPAKHNRLAKDTENCPVCDGFGFAEAEGFGYTCSPCQGTGRKP